MAVPNAGVARVIALAVIASGLRDALGLAKDGGMTGEQFDAALRINGQIIFTDTTDEIEERMLADMAEDDAKDAIVAAAIEWTAAHYPEERGEADQRLRAAVNHYEAVRTHARPGGAR